MQHFSFSLQRQQHTIVALKQLFGLNVVRERKKTSKWPKERNKFSILF